MMRRDDAWQEAGMGRFDLLVIGGGIVGARVAFDAARVGLRVVLVDAGDFGGGTSSASSKLIHSGFRYLPQGDLRLVRESQLERAALLHRVAPGLVHRLPFALPGYRHGPSPAARIGVGLLAYRALAGLDGSHVGFLAASTASGLIPDLRTEGLVICGVFEEAQTDDARLVLATVKAAAGRGAVVLNHAPVVALESGCALLRGRPGEGCREVRFRQVVNAAGPWVDRLRRLEDPGCEPQVRLSKGVHLALPLERSWRAGLAVPLEGGRVALAMPWQGLLLLGTTDSQHSGEPEELRVVPEDVRQVLAEASLALPDELLRPDRVLSAMAGLRALPLGDGDTAEARRGHRVSAGRLGMVSVAGGKLTTHRLIARDVLHQLGLQVRLSDERLPGAGPSRDGAPAWMEASAWTWLRRTHGEEAAQVAVLGDERPELRGRLHPRAPELWVQAAYAVRREWALTAEDVLRRRTSLSLRGLASAELREQVEQRLGLGARELVSA